MKKICRFLAVLLSLAMVLTMMPLFGTAARAADTDNNGLDLSKTAVLQEDGTYKLTLEAFVTGSVTVTETEQNVPLDIVMVLDVSGSMDDAITVGKVRDTSGLDTNAQAGWYYFHITFFGDYDLRYNNGKWQYQQHLSGRWVDVDSTWFSWAIGRADVEIDKINALKLAAYRFIETIGADAAEKGVEHRISVVKYADNSYYSTNHLTEGNHFTRSDYNYSELVKNLTPVDTSTGVTAVKNAVSRLTASGATAADYGMTIAAEVLDQAGVKDRASAKVVVMFTDGEPNHGSGFDSGVASKTVSKAFDIKKAGAKVYTIGVFQSPSDNVQKYMDATSSNKPAATKYADGATGTMNKDGGYFWNATSSMELTDIFQTVAQQSFDEHPSMNLSQSTTELRDVISEYFTLPADAGDTPGKYVKTSTAKCTGESGGVLTFGSSTEVSYPVTVSGNTVKVTGFDYSANWCGKRVNETGTSYSGKKLIVEISGLLPKESAFDAENPSTNAAASGIYTADQQVEKLIEPFPVPSGLITSKTVVVDYAGKIDIDTGAGTIKGSENSIKKGTQRNATAAYGTLADGSAAGHITFTPNTTKWTGTDTLYFHGDKWSRVKIMPANNVYYEDSFITGTDGVNVGIKYSNGWTVDGSTRGNAGSTVGDDGVNGWSDALEIKNGYTDGTARKADGTEGTATAEIAFNGTGIDVYTYTDITTGRILAALYKQDGEKETFEKFIYLDNKAASGKYYSVPTLSFSGLTLGNYVLKIQVTSTTELRESGRVYYYIDGIRVYNPAAADNKATFMTIVNMDGISGSVFVDEGNDEDGISYFTNDFSDQNIANNEVYLKHGYGVSFNVSGGTKYYIGMKSLTGDYVEATFTNGTNVKSIVPITHTADMYYEVTPNEDGVISVRNDGTGVLALTKLQIVSTATQEVSAEVTASPAPLMALASYKTVAYNAAPLTEEELEAPAETEIAEPEVVITEPEQPEPVAPVQEDEVVVLVKSILSSFKKLFGRS